MSKPMHLKCPACGKYIRGAVKETRMIGDGIMRRRVCEKCNVIIETIERAYEYHEKDNKYAKSVHVSCSDDGNYVVRNIRHGRRYICDG